MSTDLNVVMRLPWYEEKSDEFMMSLSIVLIRLDGERCV